MVTMKDIISSPGCVSFLYDLTFDAAKGNAAHDKFRKQQINNDDRENRECDHHINLTHVKLQKVCASKLRDQDR